MEKQIKKSFQVEVDNELYNISNRLKKETIERMENSLFASPNAIVFLLAVGMIITIAGGLFLKYIDERMFAKKALADEIHKIERTATDNYKNMLLSDEYCTGIIELGIENIKQHRENWKTPDKMIEKLDSLLQDIKKREKEQEKRNN